MRLRPHNGFPVLLLLLLQVACTSTPDRSASQADPYLWLENVDGQEALAWVNQKNEETAAVLTRDPRYAALYEEALAALNSESRVPSISERGGYLYNTWKDPAHPRGLYRRTTLESFRSNEPEWETVIDVDALGASEARPFVLGNVACLSPGYVRCMVQLKPGGMDAGEYREFDMTTRTFVNGGFFVPVAKTSLSWVDENTLFLATGLSNDELTNSGYANTVRIWHRGESIDEAITLLATDRGNVGASATRISTGTDDIDLVTESRSFYARTWYVRNEGHLARLQLPDSSLISGGYRGQLVVRLNDDWTFRGISYPRGAVIVARPDTLSGASGNIKLLVTPSENEVVTDVTVGKFGIAVTTLDDVRARLSIYEEAGDDWQRRDVSFPDNGMVDGVVDDNTNIGFYARFESFLTPSTLYFIPMWDGVPRLLKSQAPAFDAEGMEVEQLWATSLDGTRIPYFIVHKENMALDGSNPVHMFSYGGFRTSLTPSYSGTYESLSGAYGAMWLARGGVFVLPNIRGGGEFGPDWHTAALRENRHKAFEDFEAVARDLVRRGITSPKHIGIEGRSNGGLLVSATMIRHPELYGAVICGSPLADMRRYNKLLAGASWIAEYGNPDVPADWAFIKDYSPYQNLSAGAVYPPVFFYTATRDDRVHPGHARKMMAKMQAQGHEAWYFENTEGGHSSSSTNEQLAHRLALSYVHLWRRLTH